MYSQNSRPYNIGTAMLHQSRYSHIVLDSVCFEFYRRRGGMAPAYGPTDGREYFV